MEQLRFPRHAEEASAECRYAWIEDRIRLLAESFAVSVYSYAVMSNHAHIVLFVDPDEAQAWSDEDVARRWLTVFPGALRDAQSEEQKEYIELGLRSDPERMKEIRSRLGSLSWFMRALNEPIARWANEEDGCTRGRSIKARFFCFAKTADFALPTLDDSGRAGSSRKPCWTSRPC